MQHVPPINPTMPSSKTKPKLEAMSDVTKQFNPAFRTRVSRTRSIKENHEGLMHKMRTENVLEEKSTSLDHLVTEGDASNLKISLPVVNAPSLSL